MYLMNTFRANGQTRSNAQILEEFAKDLDLWLKTYDPVTDQGNYEASFDAFQLAREYLSELEDSMGRINLDDFYGSGRQEFSEWSDLVLHVGIIDGSVTVQDEEVLRGLQEGLHVLETTDGEGDKWFRWHHAFKNGAAFDYIWRESSGFLPVYYFSVGKIAQTLYMEGDFTDRIELDHYERKVYQPDEKFFRLVQFSKHHR